MIDWDFEKLEQFKNHFGLSQKEMGSHIGVNIHVMFGLIHGHVAIEPYIPRLNAMCEAVKKGKKAELECMIEFYESFK